LHTFALQAIDPQESALVRQIIVLLSALIQKDQQRSLQGGGQPGIGGSPTGGIPVAPSPMGAGGGPQAQPAGMMGR